MNENSSYSAFLSDKMIHRFEAIQNCLVPRSKLFTSQQRLQSQQLINTALKEQSQNSRRKLALFITLIELSALFFYFRRFRQLNTDKQSALLNKFFDSPIPIFRKGFWGLNTLARLGVYGQKELHIEIGYSLRENIQ